MGAPGLVKWFHSRRTEFDVVHIHFGRDLMVLPVALAARRYQLPYVLQTHGMVVPSNHPLAGPLDAMWTRKVLRDAKAVLYLNEQEREQLCEVAGNQLRLVSIPNGVPEYPNPPQRRQPPEVLFVARMHPRKRPMLFVEMAKALVADGVDARFALIGPDEGEGAALQQTVNSELRICWEGAMAPAAIPRRMAEASVYVLPSLREPYPMSVLEAMSVGLPVVIAADCGLAAAVKQADCGLVVEGQAPEFAGAVKHILSHPSAAQAMGRRGRETAQSEFGMRAIGDRLMAVYTGLSR